MHAALSDFYSKTFLETTYHFQIHIYEQFYLAAAVLLLVYLNKWSYAS